MEQEIIQVYEEYVFKSIDEFKMCITYGAEIGFLWKGKLYCAFGKSQKDENSPVRMNICEGYYEKNGKCYNAASHTEVDFAVADLWCDTVDEVLEYIVGGDRLRDVITQVGVVFRTL